MVDRLERLLKFLQRIFEVMLESLGGWGLFGVSGLVVIGLLAVSVWFSLIVGIVASIVFILRVRKQLKIEKEGGVTQSKHPMSKFEMVIGVIAVIIILTALFAGEFWNYILCSFMNCGPK